MIGNSFSEYIFIRVCIFLLQYTTPICLSCVAALVAFRGPPALSHPISKFLLGYSLADLLYAVFIYIPYNRRLKEETNHPPPLSRAERKAFIKRCLAYMPDTEQYLQMWFLGADRSEIRRENLRDFLLWAFFDRGPGLESEEDDAELDEYVVLVEHSLGRKLEPGRGRAEGLRLTLDEVETRYRSVVWYLIIGVVDALTHCQLALSGFEYHAQPRSRVLSVIPHRLQNLIASRRSASPDLSYWYQPHTAKDKLPVVFLHGIGVGLWAYVQFLSGLNERARGDEQIGIMAVEYLPVSSRLTGAPLPKADFLRQVTAILASHGWDNFVLASHSYGSVLATHMFQSETLGPRIESAVLIDPVTILLHLPNVAYNFTRRKPRRANEWLLWYFASMDPGVAHCLARHFFWKENIVWKEDLVNATREPARANGLVSGSSTAKRKRRVAVAVAEYDLIVDTLSVAQYLAGDDEWRLTSTMFKHNNPGKTTSHRNLGGGHLTEDGIELLWFPGLDHAQVFDVKESRQRLCSVLQRYCDK
ncbi:hypothetical protein DL766_003624 [Monosporascus sp. MC13-8B]|uniref:AB hydrolase-1 domain-containing protein n=1 Tax=Monosporascus cannonballus TaxID=155416 RepID=A0ABY0H699_9PEZI|nr:hypothetical protein DL762_004909 [Monosporascus cannonballus]RYO91547.1 hypothetical protein DL763_004928 [Monosporascus cannonballus]RYP33124.1 hypothetical protein DL766_003624 [Monosporascus sp. MC13-8B]